MRFNCAICGGKVSDEEAPSSVVLSTMAGGRYLLDHLPAHAGCWERWAAEYVLLYQAPSEDGRCAGCTDLIGDSEKPFSIDRVLYQGEFKETTLEALHFHDRCWPGWMRQYTRPYQRVASHPLRPERAAFIEAASEQMRRELRQRIGGEGFSSVFLAFLDGEGRAPLAAVP